MVFLIDINLLLALAWPNHPHHALASAWFQQVGKQGWATSAVTQLGFIRISSHPGISPHHTTPGAAHGLLLQWTQSHGHQYWQEPDGGLLSPDFAEVLPQIATHNFVTDAFLVSLARHHQGRLATLDHPLARLYPDTVELVG